MSYILDALRSAQAERERGQVPGLDARTVLATPTPPGPRRAATGWLAALLALILLGAAALLALRSGTAVVPAVAPGAAVPSAAVPSAALPAPPLPPASASASAVPAAVQVAAPALVVVSAPPPVAAPLEAASSPLREVQLAQLGAELRRELPALVLGGAIWSDSAASRFVIVNGQVLREGDLAAPGVVLQRIGPKAVFLRWRDWRIEVPI